MVAFLACELVLLLSVAFILFLLPSELPLIFIIMPITITGSIKFIRVEISIQPVCCAVVCWGRSTQPEEVVFLENSSLCSYYFLQWLTESKSSKPTITIVYCLDKASLSLSIAFLILTSLAGGNKSKLNIHRIFISRFLDLC